MLPIKPPNLPDYKKPNRFEEKLEKFKPKKKKKRVVPKPGKNRQQATTNQKPVKSKPSASKPVAPKIAPNPDYVPYIPKKRMTK